VAAFILAEIILLYSSRTTEEQQPSKFSMNSPHSAIFSDAITISFALWKLEDFHRSDQSESGFSGGLVLSIMEKSIRGKGRRRIEELGPVTEQNESIFGGWL